MEISSEIKNINKVPSNLISIDERRIKTEIQMDIVKKESDCLIQPELKIKTEVGTEEYEVELPVFASTSDKMYPNYDMEIATNEPMVKIKSEDLLEEMVEDPLDVSSEIKAEHREHFLLEEIKKTETECEEYDDNSSCSSALSNEEDGKHTCHICQKIFPYQSYLTRHLHLHTGEKPFTCNICKKSFNRKYSLNTHMVVHSGEKPHICDVCNRGFTRKSSLAAHKLIHSGVRAYPCSECNKAFKLKVDLTRHQRIHTGDKPYSCEMCNRTFGHKAAFISHQIWHSGEQFPCDICNKLFAYKSSLTKHRKTHKE